MSDAPVLILGAGGLAREVADYLAAGGVEVLGFIEADRTRQGEYLNGVPILGTLEDAPIAKGIRAIAGAGEIRPRRRQVAEILSAGLPLASAIHPSAVISPSATLGAGIIIAPGAVVSANSVIGDNVLVNYGATVGHDVRVGGCGVIGPGSRVSGWVTMMEDCYLGAAATILPKLTLGAGSVVGAGAVVTRDVNPGATVVGVPAREATPSS